MSEARLQVSDPQGRRVVPLTKELFTIGRRTNADLQVVNSDVSREHAEISKDESGFLLRDRGSRYGTFVNGEAITEKRLAHGDRIRLGRTDLVELVFQIEGEISALGTGTSDLNDLRQMAAVLNGLRALGSGRVLEEVLMLVLDSALDVTKADRGFVMLPNPEGELEFRTARGRGHVTLPGTSFTTSAKIPKEVFRSGKSQMVGDLMDGDLAAVHDGTIAVGIRHVLCVPLVVTPMAGVDARAEHRVIGVLYLDGRERTRLLSRSTQESLEAFATQAALAIESARLYAESAEKARTDRDLRVAADIQRALLPEPAYRGPFCELAATSIPCRTVGGDFFDYLELPEDGFAFALGDVAGKGPPAALLAATVQSNFVAHAPVSNDPAETISRINKSLLRRAIEARFATMFYGTIGSDGVLRYCNAGQEAPALVHAGEIEWLEVGGPVIGLLDFATYEHGTGTLQPGDLILVCSDGITEARNMAGEEFGRERLSAVLAGTHGASPDAVLDRVMAAVRVFSQGTPQGDDLTALVVRYSAPAGSRQ
jgi:serine phosphatase RsbU (regulator of sigma subunit)/pSer/pThr/pTyr-binding forkhead associated (FHA) protein